MFLILFNNCGLIVIILPFRPWRPEEGVELSRAWVMGGHELPSVVLGTQLWSSGKAAAAFFLATEPSLQPPVLSFWDRTSLCCPGRPSSPGLEQFSCFYLLIKPASRDLAAPRMSSGSLRDLARPPDTLVFPSGRSCMPIEQPQTWPVVGENSQSCFLCLLQWLSPSEAAECFLSKEIWLAPPQFYEMRRLATFTSLSAL